MRGVLYYLPMVAGLVVPWLFLIPEALAAPWMKRYARQRDGLFYAGLWAVIGVATMSLMQFKKPYYILPAVPGLILLMAVVADRFFGRSLRDGALRLTLGTGGRFRTLLIPSERRFAWCVWGLMVVAGVVAMFVGHAWLRKHMPTVSGRATLIAACLLIAVLTAGVAYMRGRGWAALGITAVATIAAFHAAWYGCAPAIEALGEADKVAALARALDTAGAPPDAKVLWTDRTPDARLIYGFNRSNTYMVSPEEIVNRMVDRTKRKRELQNILLGRADELLESATPVYLILQRRHYNLWTSARSHKGHLVAAVSGKASHPDKDWMIISNVGDPDR